MFISQRRVVYQVAPGAPRVGSGPGEKQFFDLPNQGGSDKNLHTGILLVLKN